MTRRSITPSRRPARCPLNNSPGSKSACARPADGPADPPRVAGRAGFLTLPSAPLTLRPAGLGVSGPPPTPAVMPHQLADRLRDRTFVALLVAQFLAAFNDQAIHAAAMFFAINS